MSEWEREGEEERASEINCFVRTCMEHEQSGGRDSSFVLRAVCWEEAAAMLSYSKRRENDPSETP